jgi:hypothetical protein
MIKPFDEDLSQRDVVDAPNNSITVVRISFKFDDNQTSLPDKFNGRYPMHCHIL